MKSLVFLVALVPFCSAVSFFSLKSPLRGPKYNLGGNELESRENAEWEAFKSEHGKSYSNEEEDIFRKAVFLDNLEYVFRHNVLAQKGYHNYTLQMNRHGDLMSDEFVQIHNGYKKDNKKWDGAKFLGVHSSVKIPNEIDWRQHGAVTPIKDQGTCGSCWAFSSTGSLEGQHYRKTGRLVSLSEQNLVDCSRNFGNDGCNGGLMDDAFKYIKANGGIDTEASYPYLAEDQPCNFHPSDIGATDKGYMDIPKGSEAALKEAVAIHGPISVAIDASHRSFQFYKEGIYADVGCEPDDLDHGVLVVGYGSLQGKDYWIVKNSWGLNWGEAGYILMARNQENMCGIASEASFPLV